MIEKEYNTKIKHVLKQIAKENSEKGALSILNNSLFKYENHWNQKQFPNAYDLNIYLKPDIFSEIFMFKGGYESDFKKRINKSFDIMVDKVNIIADLNKLVVSDVEVRPVITKWDELNLLQQKLIDNLENSTDSIDYQNIGNTTRTLMDKLAREVFNPEKHKSDNPNIELFNGRFKNQLNTFIRCELKGKNNKELRKVAESSIQFVENSIDLMNTTTHKHNVERHFAELCVISTINAVSIIKIINEIG